MEYLFVYGTLLQNSTHEMSTFLASHAQFIAKGFCYGKLYKISWFPGAVLSDKQTDKIYGSLVKLEDSERIFKQLDGYEGYDCNNVADSLFIREKTRIFAENGSHYDAWVYLYNQKTDEATRILSGDFLNNASF